MRPLGELRILVIGAHPDDCEVKVGGTAARWAREGAFVKFLSMTDGSAGHWKHEANDLAAIRRLEAEAASRILGVDCEVLANRDGCLEPTLERRFELIRFLRRERPDLVITHRPNDYHPDHRYTAQLVQDSSYLITVPKICSDTPHLESSPVFAFMEDSFTRPVAFRADVVVSIDDALDAKWQALAAHESQFFEWLPFNQGILDSVPPAASPEERLEWLKGYVEPWLFTNAGKFGLALGRRYGALAADRARRVEAFELSEYGHCPELEEFGAMFPF